MKRNIASILLALVALWASAAIDTVKINSKFIPSPAPVCVYTPTGASTSGQSDPTLYLLNGHGGDHTSWGRITNLDSLATAYGMIIVCPAGMNSWYFDSPVDATMKMESYMTRELVPWIDSHYPTKPEASQRAITGLSMGGHGGLWLGFRHPELWLNVGSTSGGVDFTPWPKSWNLPDRLGAYRSHKKSWHNHTVKSLVPRVAVGRYNIIFDCGTEDFFFDVNNALHRQLDERGIKHTYLTSPGAHNAAYWRRSIIPQLQFFTNCFKKQK